MIGIGEWLLGGLPILCIGAGAVAFALGLKSFVDYDSRRRDRMVREKTRAQPPGILKAAIEKVVAGEPSGLPDVGPQSLGATRSELAAVLASLRADQPVWIRGVEVPQRVTKTWPDESLGVLLVGRCPDCAAEVVPGPGVHDGAGHHSQRNVVCPRCGAAFNVGAAGYAERLPPPAPPPPDPELVEGARFVGVRQLDDDSGGEAKR